MTCIFVCNHPAGGRGVGGSIYIVSIIYDLVKLVVIGSRKRSKYLSGIFSLRVVGSPHQ